MSTIRISLAAAVLATLPLCAAHAQSSTDVLRAELARAMPPIIGKDNSALIKRLISYKPDTTFSAGFDPAKVSKLVFGRNVPTAAPDCTIKQTATKEPDSGLCINEVGKRDDETGAYSQLAFSKIHELGVVRYINRKAFKVDGTPTLANTKLTDAEAYQKALDFLAQVGVPKSEIPVAPPNARNPFPVRSLAIGGGQEKATTVLLPAVQKVVNVQRAFNYGTLFTDAKTGFALSHVLVPGNATVVLDDTGIQYALVNGWGDPHIDPKIDPSQAKTVDELLDEITEDLEAEGIHSVGSVSILIGLLRATPNPDDPNPPLCPACGVLRPGIRVIVSEFGDGSVTQQVPVAPGVVREYDLVAHTEAEIPAR